MIDKKIASIAASGHQIAGRPINQKIEGFPNLAMDILIKLFTVNFNEFFDQFSESAKLVISLQKIMIRDFYVLFKVHFISV